MICRYLRAEKRALFNMTSYEMINKDYDKIAEIEGWNKWVSDITLIGDQLHLLGQWPENGNWLHFAIDTSVILQLSETLPLAKKSVSIHPNKSMFPLVKKAGALHPELDQMCYALPLKSKRLLIVHGFDANEKHMICEYSPETEKWSQWDWAPSSVLNRWCIWSLVCTKDERYIFQIGDGSDRIIIYDLQKREHRNSAMKCPKGAFEDDPLLEMFVDTKRDELITFGFIRKSFKESAFQYVQDLPNYLIGLIAQWYSNEFVLWMSWKIEGKELARFFVDDILSSGDTVPEKVSGV